LAVRHLDQMRKVDGSAPAFTDSVLELLHVHIDSFTRRINGNVKIEHPVSLPGNRGP
jgi:hypothetical protein